MPSLGCNWMTSLLGSLLPSLSGNIGCGTGLKTMTTSEDALLHALSGAQVERHSGPAPVAHLGLHRGEGLGAAVGVLRVFLVTGDGSAVGQAGSVLAGDGAALDVVRRHRLERLQDFEFLVADGFAVDVGGWLHRDQAQHLQQMVLHHVAQRAGVVVVPAAGAHTQ